MGFGLALDPSSQGHYVIIAGGTGVLPFLDFFYYLLKKITFEYFSKSMMGLEFLFNDDGKEYVNNFVYGKFSLTFFGAFSSDENFYGYEIIENLAKICSETNKRKYFRGYVKVKNSNRLGFLKTTKERFTA